MAPLPTVALSIRQPWAWLIVNGHKDIENRDWPTRFRGPALIHSGKGMTKHEYAMCQAMADHVGADVVIPPWDELERGGVVGVATIVDCVRESRSPWFVGRYGFVLRDARPLPFSPARGQLGFFQCGGIND